MKTTVLIVAERQEVESECRILRHAGCEIEVVTSLPELDGFNIVIIKDLSQPFQTLKEIKKRNLPVIAILKKNEEELALKLTEHGLDNFILSGERAYLLISHVLEKTLENVRVLKAFEDAKHEEAGREKLIDVAELTAGVVHEIRNPLSIIAMSVEYLVTKMDENDPRKPFADAILRKVEKIESLIKTLVKFGRPQRKEFKVHEINKLVLQVLELIKPKCEQLNIEQTEELYEKQLLIKADADSIEEVLLNLLNNAIDSMPDGGKLTIKTYPERSNIIIEIGDTGKGVVEEEKEKIFIPFYSKKKGGVGLGLAISKRIISDHGGKIWVENASQRGAIFKVLLPGEQNEDSSC